MWPPPQSSRPAGRAQPPVSRLHCPCSKGHSVRPPHPTSQPSEECREPPMGSYLTLPTLPSASSPTSGARSATKQRNKTQEASREPWPRPRFPTSLSPLSSS